MAVTEAALVKVAGCDEPSRVCDIVFVHGLNGDDHTTWEQPPPPPHRRIARTLAFWLKPLPPTFWPAWIANDFSRAGVWSLGYPAASTAWKGHAMPLPDRATNVLQLFHLRGLGQRPILLVVHSLGGLLVKQMLQTAATQKNAQWEPIGRSIAGILFLATPHAGAFLAAMVDVFRVVSRANWTIADLQPHEPHLRSLNTWFRSNFAALGIRSHVLCETKSLHSQLVVNQTSVDPGIPAVRVIPVDKDHLSICKPLSVEDPVYLETRAFLSDCINSWQVALSSQRGSIDQARQAITDTAAPGTSYHAFPHLIQPASTLRNLRITLAATVGAQPLPVIKWVVRYRDAAGEEHQLVQTGSHLSVHLPGPIAASPVGIYALLVGTPSRILFRVSTPLTEENAEWVP